MRETPSVIAYTIEALTLVFVRLDPPRYMTLPRRYVTHRVSIQHHGEEVDYDLVYDNEVIDLDLAKRTYRTWWRYDRIRLAIEAMDAQLSG